MLNVLSLFSGIGAFEKALENLGIEHNVLAYCEIDEYASKSYSIIHNISENKNLWDVTKIDFLDIEERVDLVTYGFPCQDISICGKQKGFVDEDGNRTRSGLFFEALRIIDDYRPKFAIAENVKALTSKKFAEEFRIVLESLDEIGYNNYYAVLNLKDYGRPQNRERVFIVSIRKDIDRGFDFPRPIPLAKTLSDYIESGSVDRDISLCITARYDQIRGNQDYMRRRYFGKSISQVVYENTSREEQLNFYNKDRYGVFECDGYLRPLNERECFALQGFDPEDADNCREGGVSLAQLYKQAGNSIGVSVLEAICKSLAERYDEFRCRNPFEVAV